MSGHYLITGGACLTGSHLLDELVARGDHVTVLDDVSAGRGPNIKHLFDPPQVSLVELSAAERHERRLLFTSTSEVYGKNSSGVLTEEGRRKPDTTALRELTGWEPTRTVDDVIDDVILHERAVVAGEGESALAP